VDFDFRGRSPFEGELVELQRRRIELRQAESARVRPNPLIEPSVLDDQEEAILRGVSIIRQSLRELFTGETARIVDTSSPTELKALDKQLETRKVLLEAALKELSGQLTRLRNRERELETAPSGHTRNGRPDATS
jgi:hypothetical protein